MKAIHNPSAAISDDVNVALIHSIYNNIFTQNLPVSTKGIDLNFWPEGHWRNAI